MKIKIILTLVVLFAIVYVLNGQKKDCEVDPKSIQTEKVKESAIIDVRTLEEYNAGHLKEALLIEVTSWDFEEKISKLDKSKQYYVYCRSGKRSARAQAIMQELGFEKVCNVQGGILRMKEEGILWLNKFRDVIPESRQSVISGIW